MSTQEIRYVRSIGATEEVIDEVYLSDVCCHIERMGDDVVWIGLSRGRGAASRLLHLQIFSEGEKLVVQVQEDELGCTETHR